MGRIKFLNNCSFGHLQLSKPHPDSSDSQRKVGFRMDFAFDSNSRTHWVTSPLPTASHWEVMFRWSGSPCFCFWKKRVQDPNVS